MVGGLDVMKELHENGELIEMFEGADKLKTKLKYLTKKSKVSYFTILTDAALGLGYFQQDKWPVNGQLQFGVM